MPELTTDWNILDGTYGGDTSTWDSVTGYFDDWDDNDWSNLINIGGTVLGMYGANQAGDAASDASRAASQAQMQAQQRALDYQMAREAAPQYYRESAFGQLAPLYGISPAYDQSGDTTGAQQNFMNAIKADPRYQSMIDAGSDAVARTANMTGGMRSGNAIDAFRRSDQNVLNDLYRERVAGLSGFANLPQNTQAIANTMQGIGTTQAGGLLGQGQAQQQQLQNQMGVLGLGMQNYLNPSI